MSYCVTDLYAIWEKGEDFFDMMFPEHKDNSWMKQLLKDWGEAEDAILKAEKDQGHAEMRAELAAVRIELLLSEQRETTNEAISSSSASSEVSDTGELQSP